MRRRMSVDVPAPVWHAVHAAVLAGPWPPADAPSADVFVEQAGREGLLPLLFETPGLPDALRGALARHEARRALAVARAQILGRALRTLAEAMGDEPFVVLKGADYAFRLYPRPDLRPMQDLDVLVPAARMDAVCDRLRSAGLRPRPPRAGAREAPSYYERTFLLGDAIVEVHQAFVQRTRARVDYGGLWQRRVPWPDLGPAAARLDDADGLAYHALALAKDEFTVPLVRYVDLWLMIRARPELTQAAAARATEWRTGRAFFGALRQAARFIPDLAAPAVQDTARALVGPIARAFLSRFVLPPAEEQGRERVVTRRRQLWRKFWLMDDSWRRLSFAAEHVAAAARAMAGRALR